MSTDMLRRLTNCRLLLLLLLLEQRTVTRCMWCTITRCWWCCWWSRCYWQHQSTCQLRCHHNSSLRYDVSFCSFRDVRYAISWPTFIAALLAAQGVRLWCDNVSSFSSF